MQVDLWRLFPASGERRDELPLWVKAFGAKLEPVMAARQKAWLRRSDGSYLAAVELPVTSGNDRSRLTMSLWLPPHLIHLPDAGGPPPGSGP